MTENPVPSTPPESGAQGMQPPTAAQPAAAEPEARSPLQPSIRTLQGLEHLTTQFLLAEATRLAAAGEYAGAEAHLAAIPEGRKQAPVLDLLARIRAQQGRPAEAAEFWQMAVQMDPANADYRAGLAYVEKAAKAPFHPSRLPGLILRLLAGLLVLGLFIAVLVRLGGLERQMRMIAAAEPGTSSQTVDLSGLQGRLDDLEKGVSGLRSDLAEAADGQHSLQTGLEELQTASAADWQSMAGRLEALDQGQKALLASQAVEVSPLDLKFSIDGLTLTAEGEDWLITPQSGLFRYGWLLNDAARPALEQFAREMAPWAGQAQVDLIGYAAEDEQDPNFNLAMIRAVLVADVLLEAGLPAEMIRILPAAGRPSPFDNATFSGRAANRTVIILIHRPR